MSYFRSDYAGQHSSANTAFRILLFVMAAAVVTIGCAVSAYHVAMVQEGEFLSGGFLPWPQTADQAFLCRFVPGRVLGFALAPRPVTMAKFSGFCMFVGGLMIVPFVFRLRARGYSGTKLAALLPLFSAGSIFLGVMSAIPSPPAEFSLGMKQNVESRTSDKGVTIPFSAVSDFTLMQVGKPQDDKFAIDAV